MHEQCMQARFREVTVVRLPVLAHDREDLPEGSTRRRSTGRKDPRDPFARALDRRTRVPIHAAKASPQAARSSPQAPWCEMMNAVLVDLKRKSSL